MSPSIPVTESSMRPSCPPASASANRPPASVSPVVQATSAVWNLPPCWSSESVHRFRFLSVQVPVLIPSLTLLNPPTEPPLLLLLVALKVKEKRPIGFNANVEDSDGRKVSSALVLVLAF